MFNLLEKLQRLPENKRRAIALGATVVLSVIILGIWIANLNFSAISSDDTQAAVSQALSPVDSLGNIISGN